MLTSLTACDPNGLPTYPPTTPETTRSHKTAKESPTHAPTIAEDNETGGTEKSDKLPIYVPSESQPPTLSSDERDERHREEAIKVYLEYQKLETMLLSQDKISGEPPWLKKYAMDEFYTYMLAQFDRMDEATYRFEEGAEGKTTIRVKTDHVNETAVYDDEGNYQERAAVVILLVCTDMTKVNVVDKKTGKPIRKASYSLRQVWLQHTLERTGEPFRIDGMKLTRVPKCPF